MREESQTCCAEGTAAPSNHLIKRDHLVNQVHATALNRTCIWKTDPPGIYARLGSMSYNCMGQLQEAVRRPCITLQDTTMHTMHHQAASNYPQHTNLHYKQQPRKASASLAQQLSDHSTRALAGELLSAWESTPHAQQSLPDQDQMPMMHMAAAPSSSAAYMPYRSLDRTNRSSLLNSSAISWYMPMYSSMPPDTPLNVP